MKKSGSGLLEIVLMKASSGKWRNNREGVRITGSGLKTKLKTALQAICTKKTFYARNFYR
ncbi:MAG: hypothetical protein QW261_12860 [Candidatus Jordarchaeaceae archaeon]